MKKCNCPQCGYLFEAHTSINSKATPRPGDYSVCINCACYLQFEKDLTVKYLSEQEIESILDPFSLFHLNIIKLLILEKKENGKV